MSKKLNRISVNKLESILQDNIVTVPMEGNQDVEITIRRILPLQEVLQFVEDVVSSCIDEETGQYIPEIQAFMVRASVLTRYANFTLPKDPEKQYHLIYNTDAFQQVMGYIDRVQYDEILYAINERIRHGVAMAESALAAKMSELTAKLNSFIDNSEELFGSVKGDDMATLVKNLANAGSIDEGKLVEAVFDAQKKTNERHDDNVVVASDGDVVTLRKRKG